MDEWKAIKSRQDREHNGDTKAENLCCLRNKDKFNKFKQWYKGCGDENRQQDFRRSRAL